MPVFTATPAASTAPATLQVLVEHQPRERAIRCTGCGAGNQWDAQHGYCNSCIDRGRLHTSCRCSEGVRAAQAVTA